MVRLIPRETKFFDMFAEVADNLVAGAKVLSDCLHQYDYEKLPAVVEKIKQIEHHGDDMTHRILIKLNQTFITPFDREDIHLLASSLDDVLDFINGASDRLLTYKITQPSPSAKILAAIVLKQAEELGKAVAMLGKNGKAAGALRGGQSPGERSRPGQPRSHRPAVRRRIRSHHPDQTERASGDSGDASDKAEDVANVLETVALKNA